MDASQNDGINYKLLAISIDITMIQPKTWISLAL